MFFKRKYRQKRRPIKIIGKPFLSVFFLFFLLLHFSFSSSYDKSWNFDWSGIRPQVKDSILALKKYGNISFGTRGNGRIETKQFNRQEWISKYVFDSELIELLDYPDGTVKGLSFQILLKKQKKLKYKLLKKALNDSLTFVHFQMGCVGSGIMLNEYLSFFAFDEFQNKDFTHLKDGLTEKQFLEIKALYIERKSKEDYYIKLYREMMN